MGKVRILSEEVANRIAAGEVVERPVSIVKELVENAIDAESTRIVVQIENGGKKLIQVSDNGFGMSEDDALQSFERHATSKIQTVSDIFNISSLGFRGEALPSIASICRLTMITRDAESTTASKIVFDSGKLIDFSKTSANIGTIVTIKRLFSNVPARKKFLKTDKVEFKHIDNYLHYQSILHPQIHFQFIADGKEKQNFPAVENSKKRMIAVFGAKYFQNDIIEIKHEINNLKLSGYIAGLNEESGAYSDYRYLFVNGRFIKDKIIFHAIRAAYAPFIAKLRIYQNGKIPPFILFLNIDPQKIDFNVHPAKMEVRFNDSGSVYNFVKTLINKELLAYESNRYDEIKTKLITPNLLGKTKVIDQKIFKNKSDRRRFSDVKKEIEEIYQPDIFREKTIQDTRLEKNVFSPKQDILLRPEEDIINPWQLHQSYIFVQTEDGLLVIDQHAAHERIIYEKLLHRIHGTPPNTQKLLFPIVIDLPPHMSNSVADMISENLEILEKIGFSIKTFSGNSIAIDEIPIELENWDGGNIFLDILKQSKEEFGQTEDFRDSLAKSVACKAALKAGAKLTKKEMLTLINDLFACEVPYYCPHGRPLIIKMTINDFEKKFKRII